MAITDIDEIWQGRSSSYDAQYKKTYKRRFRVFVDDTTDHSDAIYAHDDIPQNLEVHPSNATALVSNRNIANENEDPLIYLVDVEYSSAFDADPNTYADDPFDRPALTNFSFEKGTRAVQYDLDDQAIDNSASVPLSPPLEMDFSIPVITITKNYADDGLDSVIATQDCVNDDAWTRNGTTYPAGTVKVRGVAPGDLRHENGVTYRPVTFTLVVNYIGWRPHKVLDMGFSELIAGEQRTIRNISGVLPNASRLNGAGLKLASGADPVFLEFNLNREIDFDTEIPA